MNQEESVATVRKLKEDGNSQGIIDWIKSQKVELFNASLSRHLVLWAEGKLPLEDPDWTPDWTEPETFKALQGYLYEKLIAAEADEIPQKLQILAAKLIRGEIKERKKRGRPKNATITSNVVLAQRVLPILRKAGIPFDVSTDWRGDRSTGCYYVATALGVSEKTVQRWWQNCLREVHAKI